MDYEEFDNAESFEHLFMAEPKNAESTVQFDAEDYEENQENPNQDTSTRFTKQYFTFDDVPPSKWRERCIEMLTWCTAELQYYTIDIVIKRFLTRLQGRLRDCPWEDIAHAREEFLKMKCCSFQKKDLEKHYDRINEAYRALEAKNVTIAQTTLGELYQLILNALAKLCNQKKFLAEFKRTGKCLGTACDDEYLQINCKDKSYDEPSDSVLCTIAYSELSSDKDSDTDSLEVIAFFDTGSSISILNPNILPDHYWKPHHQNFMAANGEKIVIEKISIPINIRLFPKCVIKRRLLGLSSHGKDLLIGFDILHKLPNLRCSSEGLHYIIFFNPWTAMHHLLVASIAPPTFNINNIKQRLIQTCCASSHTEFLTKHPSPLWLNPLFFVSLPFKQNEDVNLTKSSHPEMNHDHYQLAKEEREQLVSQGIIENTTSPWACKAFYVNRRSEQKKSLFQHLADAKVLSKFDLKSGFWQLGIKSEDRPKMEFCIPDHHYQWKSHAELLSKFYSLVTKYGIMLSKKNMDVGVTTIQFLGMEISDGRYQPQPHVAQELLKFPDELSSQKMIQQFLGGKILKRCKPSSKLHSTLSLNGVLGHFPKKEGSSSNTTPTVPVFDLPEEIVETIGDLTFEKRAKLGIKPEDRPKMAFCIPDHHYQWKSHAELLSKFYSLVTKYGIMLSEKKMEVGVTMIQFLGIEIFDGRYQPQPHWKFTVKHIKGTENDLVDFLSRPKAYKLEENYSKDASRVQNYTPHFLSMVFSVTSQKEERSSSNTTPTVPVFDLPEEIVETIGDLTFEKRAKICYKTFLTILLKNHGLCIKGLRFHPDYPFLNIFYIHDLWRFPKEALYFFYYLFESFTIGITFNAEKLLSYVIKSQFKDVPPILNIYLLCYNGQDLSYHLKPLMMTDLQFTKPHIALFTTGTRLTHPAKSVKETFKLFIQTQESKDHPDAYKWIEANRQWLYDNIDHCEVETSDDDDDARSLWSSDDNEHFDPFEDDPTHPDARWNVNPTKASHPGMNPDHYQLAKEECEQLVSKGIIEPTTSPWACEAFYVNRRSEQVRGKLRLVINYQPLNHFLADDKFPLTQKKSLFQYLADAKVLSKFDLKSGFWQLVTKYGIMLSEKKMEVGVATIQFLGMEISNGRYQPQPHVAQELLKFPDELSSQKMIQQFLGLVNYMADFLPKLSHHTV
nr:hypothetical protein [Tanacetum cinerariifolium]